MTPDIEKMLEAKKKPQKMSVDTLAIAYSLFILGLLSFIGVVAFALSGGCCG